MYTQGMENMLPADAIKDARISMTSEVTDETLTGTIVARLDSCNALSVRWDETGRVDALHWRDVATYKWEVTITPPVAPVSAASDTIVSRVVAAMDKPARAPRKPSVPKYKPESSPPATLPHGRRLARASDVYLELDDIKGESREHFVCFMLDVRHKIIARRVIAIGTMTGVEVHPCDTFRQAIIDGAAAVIFAHNHPSGDPAPSRPDIELTARLREVGEICGIVVLDHVVVASGGFISLSERGWK